MDELVLKKIRHGYRTARAVKQLMSILRLKITLEAGTLVETNGQMSWCFDGVMIVHGTGGSTYGTEVTHIKLIYSRESGALNSGDVWRNGSSDYNIETFGHGQVGLAPSSGSLSVTEQTDPDGAGSTRSKWYLLECYAFATFTVKIMQCASSTNWTKTM